jgi:hypothetical protein
MKLADGGFYGMIAGLFAAFVGLWRASDSWTKFIWNIIPAVSVLGSAGLVIGGLIAWVAGYK